MPVESQYILYVNKEQSNPNAQYTCGSQCCMDLALKLPEDIVAIQDVSVLKENIEKMPDWLNGSPILLNCQLHDIKRGSVAIRELQKLVRVSPKSGNPRVDTQYTKPTPKIEPPADDRVVDDRKITDDDLQSYMNKRRSLDDARSNGQQTMPPNM